MVYSELRTLQQLMYFTIAVGLAVCAQYNKAVETVKLLQSYAIVQQKNWSLVEFPSLKTFNNILLLKY